MRLKLNARKARPQQSCFLAVIVTLFLLTGSGAAQNQCLTSGTTWQNTALPAVQTGTFTVTFDATPAATGINSVIALSQGAQTAYTGFAALVAFNASGIQARNGGVYAATTPMSYSGGTTYHFREVINVPAHTYSVFVTAPGGSEQTLASNFAFRTEQNAVTSLDNWGLFASAGSATVCNFTLGSPASDFTLSATPGSRTVTAGNVTSYTAAVGATNGFSGSVGLSVNGLPAGTTASFSPSSVSGSGSSTLTVSTSSSTAAGSYTLTITGASGSLTHSAMVTLIVNPVAPSCVTATAGGAWQNTLFANQTGTFAVQFDASVSVSPANAVVGLSNGAQTAYTGFAALARFNPSGDIDARNAGTYAADNVIPYSAGVTYHFRMVVNIPAHTYSVFVTAPGAAEQAVGSNFMFRTEQNTVSQLNWWGAFSSVGSETACNFTPGTSGGTPDFTLGATPGSQTVTPGSSARYTATVSALSGFNGNVALSVGGVPSGATASFSPTSIGSSGSSTLTVATGTAAAGTYRLTITGSSGSLSHTALVTLTVGSTSGSGKFFAPYTDMSLTSNLPQISSASGIKFFTMAFIIDGGGCTPVWGGLGPISGENTFAGYINTIRANGGDVVISFGGAAGSELAQVCGSVSSLQAAYQSVINKYNVKMLDFDIEGAAVGDPTSIDRRSQALARLAAANPGLQISLTLPVNPTGLDNNGISVVQSAVRFGTPVSVVTIMTMDYGSPNSNMGGAATMAATDTTSQLQSAGLHANVGIIPMIGQNDSGGEIFSLADAQTVLNFAQSHSNITRLSFWSVSRDNGGCPGNTAASDTCSGVSQSNWAFSHIFEPF
ncbi:MAG TPA: chitinase [Terriglobales bacterium]|nr:chitinase [Terriglobales bacterium]